MSDKDKKTFWMRRREAIRDQAEKILLRLHFMHIRQNL